MGNKEKPTIYTTRWIKKAGEEGHFERNIRLCHYLVLMEKLLAGYDETEAQTQADIHIVESVLPCPVTLLSSLCVERSERRIHPFLWRSCPVFCDPPWIMAKPMKHLF